MSKSQNAQILWYLKCGRHLTPLAALRLFNCLRLASRVYELRQQGHRIMARTVAHRGKHFAEYFLV